MITKCGALSLVYYWGFPGGAGQGTNYTGGQRPVPRQLLLFLREI